MVLFSKKIFFALNSHEAKEKNDSAIMDSDLFAQKDFYQFLFILKVNITSRKFEVNQTKQKKVTATQSCQENWHAQKIETESTPYLEIEKFSDHVSDLFLDQHEISDRLMYNMSTF